MNVRPIYAPLSSKCCESHLCAFVVESTRVPWFWEIPLALCSVFRDTLHAPFSPSLHWWCFFLLQNHKRKQYITRLVSHTTKTSLQSYQGWSKWEQFYREWTKQPNYIVRKYYSFLVEPSTATTQSYTAPARSWNGKNQANCSQVNRRQSSQEAGIHIF